MGIGQPGCRGSIRRHLDSALRYIPIHIRIPICIHTHTHIHIHMDMDGSLGIAILF